MMIAGKLLRYRLACLILVPTAAMAFLASGCLWGVVTDSETGAGLSGVTVTYTDADGNTASTTTDSHGLYAFDIADGPIPATGNAEFEISADGYHTKTETRLIEYNDNPVPPCRPIQLLGGPELHSPRGGGPVDRDRPHQRRHLERSLAAPGGTTDYIVAISAYDPDDPGGSLCHLETGWYTITSANPPLNEVWLSCSVPGDTLEVRVYVGVRRISNVEEHDNSTAGFDWEAPSLETRWNVATLDSADADDPDDTDLAFTARIQYRSVEA